MPDVPQSLVLREHRDAAHRAELWARRLIVSALVVVAGLGLLNVFGQRPRTSAATGAAAELEVVAPDSLRGGLFYMGRFTISAVRELGAATLVLDGGWLESMQINTIEPAPVGEASRDGRLALDFGHVSAGDSITAYLEFQVNPTAVGRRSQDVALYDGEELVVRVDRTVTVYP